MGPPGKFETQTNPSMCVTPGTSARALAEAYLRYAASKNFDPTLPAAASVIKGLRKAFPCTDN